MKIGLPICFIFVLLLPASAQTVVAKLFTEIPRQPCGHITASLDGLLAEWAKNTDNRIAIIYYGARYRRNTRMGEGGKPRYTELRYPHRDDALNWAKGIPRYLIARLTSGSEASVAKNKEALNKLQKHLALIDGGYQEFDVAQIWIVPPSSEIPKPTILLTESQVKFGAKAPRPVPDYYNCYADL